jgi:hypothetical protein
VIEPRMQVGMQARVGIDAIVADGPAAAQIGLRLGARVLAAQSEPCEPVAGKAMKGITPCPEGGI